MNSLFAIRLSRMLTGLPLLLILGGCSTLGYYAQSVSGHLSLLAHTRSLAQVRADTSVSQELRERLVLVEEIRDFASHDLGLPDNDSYRRYAELDRPYVVWSVVATPEFSLEPRTWCFPFVGCVSYRGYFSRDAAQGFARSLKDRGLDVAVDGVPAYSTLGWFDDPLPSAVIRWSEPRLAGLIFHELAHQRVYVKDDSGFNEAFATVVEREGVQRWLVHRGGVAAQGVYARELAMDDDFRDLVLQTRQRLSALYARDLEPEAMRAVKVSVFREMRDAYARLKRGWEGDDRYDAWFARDLNNARLSLVATYHLLVPGFEALLARNDGGLERFYRQVETLAALPAGERRARLVVNHDQR